MQSDDTGIIRTIKQLANLESLGSLDDSEIMDYAQWSGRLSLIGLPDYINKFWLRFNPDCVNQVLVKRIAEGIVDIHESFEEYLAVEIFTVQDFFGFIKNSPKGYITKEAKVLLRFWMLTAALVPRSSSTRRTLKAYRLTYDIPKKDLCPFMGTKEVEVTPEFIMKTVKRYFK